MGGRGGGFGSAAIIILALMALSQLLPDGREPLPGMAAWNIALCLGIALLMAGVLALSGRHGTASAAGLTIIAALIAGGMACTASIAQSGTAYWLMAAALALLAAQTVRRLARSNAAWLAAGAVAVLFGLWILYFWQLLVTILAVPQVLLPSPLAIARALFDNWALLAGDAEQTVLKAVLAGYLLGSGLGIAMGIIIDHLPFLRRGLLPLANLTSTVPLVGVAPIAVMWFGFDWPSKAAVVLLVTFFPALIGTLSGLRASGRLERELMHCYAAGAYHSLLLLRLPMALPYIFSALKVNASLALISAIVAEFFGSPTAGLGFRISIEAARLHMATVWAAIVVSSAVGSGLYALLGILERRITFWHPSVREGAASRAG